VALLFVFQNTEDIGFNFLWMEFTAPMWTMLLVSMMLGAIVWWGVGRRMRARKARRAADD
jgi:uncharacterized integral membrane protein